MKTYVNTRKGMTLAELMVGIALVAVMITLVVSFVFMMSERVQVNQVNDAILGDVKKIEAVVEGWVDAMSKEDAAFEAIATTGNTAVRYLAADIDEVGRRTVKFSGKTLTAEFSEDKETAIRTEYVESVHFQVMDKGEENNKDYLVFCTVTCVNEKTGNDFEYTFTVNSRIGESYTAETETSAESESESESEPGSESESESEPGSESESESESEPEESGDA